MSAENESVEYADGPTSTVRRRRRRRRRKKPETDKLATAVETGTEEVSATNAALEVVTASGNSSSGVDSVLLKLKESVSGGDLYTALQVYKALFARFAKRGEIEQATGLAVRGTCLLLSCGLTRAGTDLGKQLVELLSESHTAATDEITDQIIAIVKAYPTHPESSNDQDQTRAVDDTCDEDCKSFLVVALEWSSSQGEYPRGHPKLNLEAARLYRRTDDAYNACLKYLFSEQCGENAQYVYELARSGGYNSECDLFLARTVLQLLAVENVRDALTFYKEYHSLVQADKWGRLDSPLVNFLKLLLDVCKRGKEALPLFQLLKARYSKSLERDPALPPCMARIATKFFDVPPPKKGGIMGMLESMLGGPPKAR